MAEDGAEPLRAKAAAVATGSSPGAASVNDDALAMDAAQIVDALDVVSWDQYLIAAKLHRALRGRHGDDDHPTQNHWNGSAKVALISIERSEAAWRLIAHWSAGDQPCLLADHLMQLRKEVEREFPRARYFVRPGFDDQPAP
jgi:hypothetical protein